jgi:hypothetical protein
VFASKGQSVENIIHVVKNAGVNIVIIRVGNRWPSFHNEQFCPRPLHYHRWLRRRRILESGIFRISGWWKLNDDARRPRQNHPRVNHSFVRKCIGKRALHSGDFISKICDIYCRSFTFGVYVVRVQTISSLIFQICAICISLTDGILTESGWIDKHSTGRF